eukprot:scaffold86574_cov36-Tisochrysis_lutea.AAC.2
MLMRASKTKTYGYGRAVFFRWRRAAGGARGQLALGLIAAFIDVTLVNAPEVAICRFNRTAAANPNPVFECDS